MRLNVVHSRNRLSITQFAQWLERSVISFYFCRVSLNQTASYSSRGIRAGLINSLGHDVFEKSDILGNHLLLDGKLDENRVVSPLSFQVVLSLLATGSGGSTRRQLLSFFNIDSVDRLNSFASRISDAILADSDPAAGPRLRCSNGLWLDRSFTLKPSFKQILDSDYRAALYPVDFQTKLPHARQHINSWVENETSGLVKDLFREGSLNNSVQLVFTNALYFKGAWDGESCPPQWYGTSRPGRRPPFLSKEDQENKNLVIAPLMTVKRNESCRWYEGCEILNLPFKKQSEDKRFVHMLFYHPGTVTKRGFVTETTMDLCGRATPKFNMSSEVEACDVLRQLGVTLPFSGGNLKEMGGSFNDPKLCVFNIFQKAFIDINEQGAEAATATTAIVTAGRQSDLPDVPILDYVADYIYLLVAGKDEGGGILTSKTKLVVTQVVNPPPRSRRRRR